VEDEWLSIDDEGDPTELVLLENLQTVVLRYLFQVAACAKLIHGCAPLVVGSTLLHHAPRGGFWGETENYPDG